MTAAAGYVYVALLSNGTVKVGRAQDAKKRLAGHKANARTLGLTLVDSWTSPPHLEWLSNEDALKGIAVELGGVPEGREAFSGIEFAAVVKEAHRLTFTDPAPKPSPKAASGERGGILTPRERAVALAALEAGMTDVEKADLYDLGQTSAIVVAMLVDQGMTLDWLHRLSPDKWQPGIDGMTRAARALINFERRIERVIAENEAAKEALLAKARPRTKAA